MTDQATSLPLWLQIVTIALAPGMGFLGVAIGAGWKDRSDKRLALRNHRQQVYSDFLRAAEDMKSHFSLRAPTVFRGNDPAELWQHTQDVKVKLSALLGVIHEVDLIGSSGTMDAVGAFIKYAFEANVALIQAVRDGLDRNEWNKIIARGTRATLDFRDAAAVDLGVPRRQRRRRGRDRSDEVDFSGVTTMIEELMQDRTSPGNDGRQDSRPQPEE